MTVGVRLLTPLQADQLALARLLTGFHCNPTRCCYRTDHVSNSRHNKRESALLHLQPSGSLVSIGLVCGGQRRTLDHHVDQDR